jgi:hypothetical protein
MTKIAGFLTNDEYKTLKVAEVIQELQEISTPEKLLVFFPESLDEDNSINYSTFTGFGVAQNVSSNEIAVVPLINSEHSSEPDMTVATALKQLKKLDPNLPVLMEIAVFAKVN